MTSTPQQRAEIIFCPRWEDFIVSLRNRSFLGPRLFRGQSNPDWKLASLFERQLDGRRKPIPGLSEPPDRNRNVNELFDEGGRDKLQNNFLEILKFYASDLPEARAANWKETDWWVVGRHYGLITPLLDWSLSPYVAAFFAYWDRLDKLNPGVLNGDPKYLDPGPCDDPVAIWELDDCGNLPKNGEFEIIGQRTPYADRQRAQQGMFTRLTHGVYLDLESYLEHRDQLGYLCCYQIAGCEIYKALRDLDLMNIKFITLFPDMFGAVREANIWQIRSQIKIRSHD